MIFCVNTWKSEKFEKRRRACASRLFTVIGYSQSGIGFSTRPAPPHLPPVPVEGLRQGPAAKAAAAGRRVRAQQRASAKHMECLEKQTWGRRWLHLICVI